MASSVHFNAFLDKTQIKISCIYTQNQEYRDKVQNKINVKAYPILKLDDSTNILSRKVMMEG